jgi:hypothetical protein
LRAQILANSFQIKFKLQFNHAGHGCDLQLFYFDRVSLLEGSKTVSKPCFDINQSGLALGTSSHESDKNMLDTLNSPKKNYIKIHGNIEIIKICYQIFCGFFCSFSLHGNPMCPVCFRWIYGSMSQVKRWFGGVTAAELP